MQERRPRRGKPPPTVRPFCSTRSVCDATRGEAGRFSRLRGQVDVECVTALCAPRAAMPHAARAFVTFHVALFFPRYKSDVGRGVQCVTGRFLKQTLLGSRTKFQHLKLDCSDILQSASEKDIFAVLCRRHQRSPLPARPARTPDLQFLCKRRSALWEPQSLTDSATTAVTAAPTGPAARDAATRDAAPGPSARCTGVDSSRARPLYSPHMH